jgi:UDP-N-acetylmuramoyl-L-alanyl-D-glutamate--2,6-diaminopimelate ligase
MEVSSHALEQRRVDGIEFSVAVFTNLTQDHLDLHANMESYFAAKRRLFTGLGCGSKPVGVFNIDDEHGLRLFDEFGGIDYGSTAGAVRILGGNSTPRSTSVRLAVREEEIEILVPIGAMFNVYNCTAAVACLHALQISPADAAAALAESVPPPGRFEAVRTDSDFDVVVDYAHTPDALQKLLESARALKPKRVIVVFGCGGDRDSTKRPKMGKIASGLADVCYITSDNPRTEKPSDIIDDIVAGASGSAAIHIDADRVAAIRAAIREAGSGDLVVIAGKGHEDYQIVGASKIHMDDRESAALAIQERAPCS